MPRLISEQVVTLEMADLDRRVPIRRPEHTLERAKGAHQSDILRYIAKKVGWLKNYPERPAGSYPWNWAQGVMWEEFYFSLHPDSEWQPGELTKDGISVNADGIVILNEYGLTNCPALEETKWTEMKVLSGEDFLRENLYMHQGREYCEQYGPRVVRWSVLYARGMYDGKGAVCKQYVVEFSDLECHQTHAMLLKFKDEAMAALGIVDWLLA